MIHRSIKIAYYKLYSKLKVFFRVVVKLIMLILTQFNERNHFRVLTHFINYINYS